MSIKFDFNKPTPVLPILPPSNIEKQDYTPEFEKLRDQIIDKQIKAQAPDLSTDDYTKFYEISKNRFEGYFKDKAIKELSDVGGGVVPSEEQIQKYISKPTASYDQYSSLVYTGKELGIQPDDTSKYRDFLAAEISKETPTFANEKFDLGKTIYQGFTDTTFGAGLIAKDTLTGSNSFNEYFGTDAKTFTDKSYEWLFGRPLAIIDVAMGLGTFFTGGLAALGWGEASALKNMLKVGTKGIAAETISAVSKTALKKLLSTEIGFAGKELVEEAVKLGSKDFTKFVEKNSSKFVDIVKNVGSDKTLLRNIPGIKRTAFIQTLTEALDIPILSVLNFTPSAGKLGIKADLSLGKTLLKTVPPVVGFSPTASEYMMNSANILAGGIAKAGKFGIVENERQAFIKEHGIDPFTTDGSLRKSWEDHINYKVRTSGAMETLFGYEPETTLSKFATATANAALNYAPMYAGFKGISKGINYAGKKFDPNSESGKEFLNKILNDKTGNITEATGVQQIQVMKKLEQIVDWTKQEMVNLQGKFKEEDIESIKSFQSEIKFHIDKGDYTKAKEITGQLFDKFAEYGNALKPDVATLNQSYEVINKLANFLYKQATSTNALGQVKLDFYKNIFTHRGEGNIVEAALKGNDEILKSVTTIFDKQNTIANNMLSFFNNQRYIGKAIDNLFNKGTTINKLVEIRLNNVLSKNNFSQPEIDKIKESVGPQLTSRIIRIGITTVNFASNKFTNPNINVKRSFEDIIGQIINNQFGVKLRKLKENKFGEGERKLSDVLKDISTGKPDEISKNMEKLLDILNPKFKKNYDYFVKQDAVVSNKLDESKNILLQKVKEVKMMNDIYSELIHQQNLHNETKTIYEVSKKKYEPEPVEYKNNKIIIKGDAKIEQPIQKSVATIDAEIKKTNKEYDHDKLLILHQQILDESNHATLSMEAYEKQQLSKLDESDNQKYNKIKEDYEKGKTKYLSLEDKFIERGSEKINNTKNMIEKYKSDIIKFNKNIISIIGDYVNKLKNLEQYKKRYEDYQKDYEFLSKNRETINTLTNSKDYKNLRSKENLSEDEINTLKSVDEYIKDLNIPIINFNKKYPDLNIKDVNDYLPRINSEITTIKEKSKEASMQIDRQKQMILAKEKAITELKYLVDNRYFTKENFNSLINKLINNKLSSEFDKNIFESLHFKGEDINFLKENYKNFKKPIVESNYKLSDKKPASNEQLSLLYKLTKILFPIIKQTETEFSLDDLKHTGYAGGNLKVKAGSQAKTDVVKAIYKLDKIEFKSLIKWNPKSKTYYIEGDFKNGKPIEFDTKKGAELRAENLVKFQKEADLKISEQTIDSEGLSDIKRIEKNEELDKQYKKEIQAKKVKEHVSKFKTQLEVGNEITKIKKIITSWRTTKLDFETTKAMVKELPELERKALEKEFTKITIVDGREVSKIDYDSIARHFEKVEVQNARKKILNDLRDELTTADLNYLELLRTEQKEYTSDIDVIRKSYIEKVKENGKPIWLLYDKDQQKWDPFLYEPLKYKTEEDAKEALKELEIKQDIPSKSDLNSIGNLLEQEAKLQQEIKDMNIVEKKSEIEIKLNEVRSRYKDKMEELNKKRHDIVEKYLDFRSTNSNSLNSSENRIALDESFAEILGRTEFMNLSNSKIHKDYTQFLSDLKNLNENEKILDKIRDLYIILNNKQISKKLISNDPVIKTLLEVGSKLMTINYNKNKVHYENLKSNPDANSDFNPNAENIIKKQVVSKTLETNKLAEKIQEEETGNQLVEIIADKNIPSTDKQTQITKILVNSINQKIDSILTSAKDIAITDVSFGKSMQSIDKQVDAYLIDSAQVRPSNQNLNALYNTYTRLFKSLNVGIAFGRAISEGIQTGTIYFAKQVDRVMKRGFTNDDQFKQYFEKEFSGAEIPSFSKTEITGLNYQDNFRRALLAKYNPEQVNKYLLAFNDKIVKTTNFVAEKSYGAVVKKIEDVYLKRQLQNDFAAKYNEMKSAGIDPVFLLKNNSILTPDQIRRKMNIINELKRKAEKRVNSLFFSDYNQHPMFIQKMEDVYPFTNFLYSGIKLMNEHPHLFLGGGSMLYHFQRQFGDDTWGIDDEGNKINLGKKLGIPLLSAIGYTNILLDTERLLQVSPSAIGFRSYPLLSYTSGLTDFRVRQYYERVANGEGTTGLLELMGDALSSSIADTVEAVKNNDPKWWIQTAGYYGTGFVMKDKTQNDLFTDYFNGDYEKLLEKIKGPAGDAQLNKFLNNKKLFKHGLPNRQELESLIEAKKLGLIGKDQNYMDRAMRIASQQAVSHLSPEDKEKFELSIKNMQDLILGKDIYNKNFDSEWLSKVNTYMKSPGSDGFNKFFPNLTKTLEHYSSNNDFYKLLYEAYDNAYGSNNEEKRLDGNITLLALRYQFKGETKGMELSKNIEDKKNAIRNGKLYDIIYTDKGKTIPLLTDSYKESLRFKGPIVESYSQAAAKVTMASNLRSVYYGLAYSTNNKTAKQAYFNRASEYSTMWVNEKARMEDLVTSNKISSSNSAEYAAGIANSEMWKIDKSVEKKIYGDLKPFWKDPLGNSWKSNIIKLENNENLKQINRLNNLTQQEIMFYQSRGISVSTLINDLKKDIRYNNHSTKTTELMSKPSNSDYVFTP